jgi:hypothetical protein
MYLMTAAGAFALLLLLLLLTKTEARAMIQCTEHSIMRVNELQLRIVLRL